MNVNKHLVFLFVDTNLGINMGISPESQCSWSALLMNHVRSSFGECSKNHNSKHESCLGRPRPDKSWHFATIPRVLKKAAKGATKSSPCVSNDVFQLHHVIAVQLCLIDFYFCHLVVSSCAPRFPLGLSKLKLSQCPIDWLKSNLTLVLLTLTVAPCFIAWIPTQC